MKKIAYVLLTIVCTIGAFPAGYIPIVNVLAQNSQTSNVKTLTPQELANQDTASTIQNSSNQIYIQTASDYLAEVADFYTTVTDFRMIVEIHNADGTSDGTMFVKHPNRMRINFNDPRGQVMSNNGEDFYIYIPTQNVALHQKKRAGVTDIETGIITPGALSQLSDNYFVSYLDKPAFVVYENNPTKKIIKLKLVWRNTSQNFREIRLSIGEDKMIYQVDAITYNYQNVKFIFKNIEINKGIPDSRFDYDPPPTAHVVDNFLFNEDATQ